MFRTIGRLGDWTARRLSRLGALARFGFGAVSRQLDHFVEEMSRRPYRLLTGVRPIPGDSAPPPTRADTAAGTGTRP